MSGNNSVREYTIASFVAQKRLFFCGRAVTLVGLAGLVLAAAAITVDVYVGLAPAWRWAACGLLMGCAAILSIGRFVLPALRYHRREAICDIERGHEEMGQMLRTSAELEEREQAEGAGFSRVLAQALNEQVDERMKTIDLVKLIDWPLVGRRALELVVLLCLFGGAFFLWQDFRTGAARLVAPAANLTFTRVAAAADSEIFARGDSIMIRATVSGRPAKETLLHVRETGGEESAEWEIAPMPPAGADEREKRFLAELAGRTRSFDFFVQAGDGRTETRRLRFVEPPAIEAVRVTLHYPEYTLLKSQVSDLGDVRAVEGTQVGVRFQLNHALRDPALHLTSGSLPLSTRDHFVFTTHTLAGGEKEYYLAGSDADNLPLRKVAYHLTGLPDRPPVVEVLEPKQDVEVTNVTEVPVRVRAKDDFGIAEVGVILEVDGEREVLATRQIDDEIVLSAREVADVLLEKHSLTINSNVKLFAFARDRKPGAERRGVSELRAIDIRPFRLLYQMAEPQEALSPEQMQQMMQNLAELNKIIEQQRGALSDTFKLKEERSNDRKQMNRIAGTEEELAGAINEARGALAETGPENAGKLLDDAAKEMNEAADELREPELAAAYESADAALSSLLQLRQNMIREISQQQQQQPGQQQQEQAPQESLADLAREAERLAQEEQDVGEQVAQLSEKQTTSSEQSDGRQQTEAQPPPDAAAMRQAMQQQEAAIEDGGELAERMQTHPAGTPLAQERMTAAEQSMRQAERQMRGGELEPARPELKQAEERLSQLAEHLEGLDPQNLAETLDAAQEMAESAAAQLEQQAQQDSRQSERQNQQSQSQSESQTQSESQSDSQSQGKSQSPGKPQRESQNEQQSEPPSDGQRRKPGDSQNQTPTDGQNGRQPSENENQDGNEPAQNERGSQGDKGELIEAEREQIAQNAETIADWLNELKNQELSGPQTLPQRLEEIQRETRTDKLGDDVRRSQQRRGQGQTGEGQRLDKDAAERFRQLAASLSAEQQRLLQSHLERLAAAKAEARELQEQVENQRSGQKQNGQQQSESGQPSESQSNSQAGSKGEGESTEERLEELADEIGELKDEKLETLADKLLRQLGPLNRAGARQSGHVIPEAVAAETLRPIAERLEELIAEIVEREMLLNRDDRVPDKYTRLVERYFKALSDDLRE